MHRNKMRGYAEAQSRAQNDGQEDAQQQQNAPGSRHQGGDPLDPWTDPWENLEETFGVGANDAANMEAPDLLAYGGNSGDAAAANPAESNSGQAAVSEEHMAAALNDMRLRQAAEMDNFKKRLSREHEEQLRYAAEKVLNDLLPTLDNLDLALQYGTNHEACNDMLQGVAMTRKLLLEAVGKHGLVPFGEEGVEFTPEFHEAVGFEQRSDLAQGAVTRVLQCGYKLKERLLRPAKVMINQ